MKRNLYLSICMLIIIILAFGCKAPSFATADAQYEKGEYFEAQKSYRKIYNSLKKRDQRELKSLAAYKSGLCYYKLNQTTRAVNAFKNSLRYGTPDSTVYLLLAQSLHRQGKIKEAREYYEEYLGIDSLSEMALNGLRGLNYSQNPDKNTRYKVSEAKFINGRRADYAPMYSKERDILYFTTTNEQVTGSVKSGVTGMKNGDIWMMTKNEQGKWNNPVPVEGGLNSDFDEGIISFSPDGNLMYLTRALQSIDKDCPVEIWTSQRSDAQWSEPIKLDLGLDTIYNYGHPSISPNGRYLYLTSDRPGGYGGYDIWRINLENRGSSLENLGPDINTSGNEMFPYMKTDTTLYFSSDGHPGLGGLDIFRADQTQWYVWSVKNLGYPLNSTFDDFGITFDDGESGFFSSNRGDERGYDHIYSFVLPELNITVNGYIMDPEEYIIPGATIRIIGNDGSNRREKVKDNGSFSFKLERGVDYILQASAPGYLNANQHFTSDIDEADAEYIVDFTLAPVNKPVVIDDIFYDFDKATLRPESEVALDSLINLLNSFPNITVELSSHTDRVGSDSYNFPLSERRAQSVMNYLINIGKIDARRLTYKGYGKTEPRIISPRLNKLYPALEIGTMLSPEFIESLEDEELREIADQLNRRTEFKITSVDFYLY